MKIFACGLVCVFFTCFWIKVNADCEYTHRGLISERIFKTGETLTDHCMLYECEEKGGWTWTVCPQWVECKEFVGFQPYNYSKPYPDCCGGPICKTSSYHQTAVSSISEDKVRPNEFSYSRHVYPADISSATIPSVISSFIISFIFLVITQ